MRGQHQSFSIHEQMFLWKCRSFRDRKFLDLRGTRTPSLRIHAECSNHLSYQGQTSAVPCLWILALVVQVYISMLSAKMKTFCWFRSWWRHQMKIISALLARLMGIHRWPVNSPHKGQWGGVLEFSLIYAFTNDWVNNRDARDLRRHRADYDVTVM